MTTYIVDATVVMSYLIADAFTVHAEAFFDHIGENDRLYTLEFCMLECTNVIWKHVRFHGLPPEQAKSLIKDLKAIPLYQLIHYLSRRSQLGWIISSQCMIPLILP